MNLIVLNVKEYFSPKLYFSKWILIYFHFLFERDKNAIAWRHNVKEFMAPVELEASNINYFVLFWLVHRNVFKYNLRLTLYGPGDGESAPLPNVFAFLSKGHEK